MKPASSVVIATTTWDSIDIIEDFLCYYERLGARRILVIDFHSTDGTRDVLGSTRWRNLVEMTDLSSLEDADTSAELLHAAQSRFGSEWCLLCDPDEFLVTPDMAIIDPLLEAAEREAAVILIPRRNMTAQRSVARDPGARLSPHSSLELRIDRPYKHSLEDHVAPELIPPWIFTDDPPKVLVRLDRIRSLHAGNHSAESEPEATEVLSAHSLLLHYPFRSYRHFEQKVSQAVKHNAAEWPPPTGWQYRRWIACQERGALFDEYLEQFVDDQDVAAMLASEALVHDTRVRDILVAQRTWRVRLHRRLVDRRIA